MTDSEREKIVRMRWQIVDFLAGKQPRFFAGDKEPLFSTGLFDSLTFVQLIAFLEKEFKVKLTPVMSDFDTLDLIVGQVEKAKEKK